MLYVLASRLFQGLQDSTGALLLLHKQVIGRGHVVVLPHLPAKELCFKAANKQPAPQALRRIVLGEAEAVQLLQPQELNRLL